MFAWRSPRRSEAVDIKLLSKGFSFGGQGERSLKYSRALLARCAKDFATNLLELQ